MSNFDYLLALSKIRDAFRRNEIQTAALHILEFLENPIDRPDLSTDRIVLEYDSLIISEFGQKITKEYKSLIAPKSKWINTLISKAVLKMDNHVIECFADGLVEVIANFYPSLFVWKKSVSNGNTSTWVEFILDSREQNLRDCGYDEESDCSLNPEIESVNYDGDLFLHPISYVLTAVLELRQVTISMEHPTKLSDEKISTLNASPYWFSSYGFTHRFEKQYAGLSNMVVGERDSILALCKECLTKWEDRRVQQIDQLVEKLLKSKEITLKTDDI